MEIKLLYIEDDFIDHKNMEWVCDHFPTVSLQIVNSFLDAKKKLEDQQFDLIITDQNVHQVKLEEELGLFKDQRFYVLSNAISVHATTASLVQGILKKPITKVEMAGLLGVPIQDNDHPNFNYFKVIDNAEVKAEMLQIIQNELESAKEKIPVLVARKDIETLKYVVHKLASKFSVLGMKTTFEHLKELENELRSGTMTLEKITFLEHQITVALSLFSTQEKE